MAEPALPPAKDAKPQRRKRIALYSIGVILALFAVLSPTIFYQPPTADLHVAGKTVSLEIASNQAAQNRGLGGRTSMPDNKGMIFVFAKPASTCLWMKDMRFSLDMVWLNGTKQVVYMQQNVSPKTYPKSFCPNAPAKYIIELNAGQIKILGIHAGETLQL